MQLKTFFRSEINQAELASAQEASYASWRRASDGVAEAYGNWTAAPPGERWWAHVAYSAALDLEERAALAYQRSTEQTQAPGERRFG